MCLNNTYTLQGSVLLFVLVLVVSGAAAGASAQKASDQDQTGQTTLSERASAGRLLSREIKNSDGEAVGELADLILNFSGRVTLAVIAVESETLPITVKSVAVPFAALEMEPQWEYRTLRRKDGTEKRVAWRKGEKLIYDGSREELLQLPEYHYNDPYPRGGVSGWGVYSYPE